MNEILPPLSFLSAILSLMLAIYPKPTAAVVLGAILPFYLASKVSSPIRYYFRLATFLIGLGTISVWGVIVSIALSLVGQSKNSNYVVARSFHGLVAPLVGFRFTVEGEEHLENKPAVVIGNHQTMIDILYLGRIFPKGCSIMAKKELQYAPLLGQFMTLSNAVFVNRSRRQDAVAVFAKVASTMKDKVLSLFIFPEGTRSASLEPTLLPLKKGAFHLAVAAQLPIIPIICENYSAAYYAKNKTFNGGDLIIKVLEPIPTIGITSSSEDITKLAESTHLLMTAAIEEIAERRKVINKAKMEK